MELWINPRCGKSRAAVNALREAGASYTVRRYLEQPPSPEELLAVLARLGLEPWEITRTDEPVAGELGLRDPQAWPRDAASRDRWIAALAEHPILIQRPIVSTDDGRAVIARTPEALQAILPVR
ncbi:arsenate reductase family protein [Streptacidiphilus sp. N1-12]|uniref:Arsenate reductase family protein n=2 Tax=Streptacidiphilus alkalitolerans TaxID=3342712 RepID=A0ABV6WC82_9ACTN